MLEWYRHQSARQVAVPRDLSRASRYPFDARVHHRDADLLHEAGERFALSERTACALWRVVRRAVRSQISRTAARVLLYGWLVQQRNASGHTVRSGARRYFRRLFLRCCPAHNRTVAQPGWKISATGSEVAAFSNTPSRSAATPSARSSTAVCAAQLLCLWLAEKAGRRRAMRRGLAHSDQEGAVARSDHSTAAEVEAIGQPDRSTLEGQRDHALLSFLYNTGARIQEALELRPNAIRWESPACVRLYGKGRKERLCPLWPETVALLKALMETSGRVGASDETLSSTAMALHLGSLRRTLQARPVRRCCCGERR